MRVLGFEGPAGESLDFSGSSSHSVVSSALGRSSVGSSSSLDGPFEYVESEEQREEGGVEVGDFEDGGVDEVLSFLEGRLDEESGEGERWKAPLMSNLVDPAGEASRAVDGWKRPLRPLMESFMAEVAISGSSEGMKTRSR